MIVIINVDLLRFFLYIFTVFGRSLHVLRKTQREVAWGLSDWPEERDAARQVISKARHSPHALVITKFPQIH